MPDYHRWSPWGPLCILTVLCSLLRVVLAVAAPTPPPLPPEPSARLSASTVSASAEGQSLLTVDVAGRFAIRAASKTGVAVQLVDMIVGPGEVSGEAGVHDGRLDVLLDRGVYKLRSSGAAGAEGTARLVVTPFHHAAPASDALLYGGTVSSSLADAQQRAYWIVVGANGQVSIEAVGRAVQDVRLWQHGAELVALTPTLTSVEPRPGRPMTQGRLAGKVEPGVYLVTVYGGVALPWSHEDSAQPLHVRVGEVPQLVGGWAEGTLGPMGSARFEVPAPDTYARLEVPEPAPVQLLGGRQGGAMQSASIRKASREPVAALTLSAAGNTPAWLEVVGFEGQRFRLRTLQPASTLRFEANGPHLIAVDVAGDGGDEVPATAVLARFERGQGTVLASRTPRIGPGQAWRRTLNLRGATTLLLEITGAGPMAAQTSGPGVRLTLEPLLGSTAPRVDGRIPTQWDVEPGWYRLKIDPVSNAVGVLDLTIGQPGLAVAAAETTPPQVALTFGIHDLAKAASYHLFTNTAPSLVTGPKVRALPVDLATASLGLWQQAASGLDLSVRLPLEGALQVVDASGEAVSFTTSDASTDKTGRTLTVHVPAPERDRNLALRWTPTVVRAEPMMPPPPAYEALAAGQPRFFNLAEGATRRLLLEVPEGGLYRLETLGRLHTALHVSTPFLPNLLKAEDNGPGHNALAQTYLRAGVYRVNVTARQSAGHLGVVATPAPLQDTVALTAGASVRASLVAGRGAVVPIDVHTAGLYRLDLYGLLGRPHTARLEDAEGWPLTPPGAMTQVEQPLQAGRYRLVVLPAEVDARFVARLTLIEPPAVLTGHGPHVLRFDQTQEFQWREPETKEAERTPDRWTFTLYGPASIVLEISDGMIAALLRADSPAPPVAKIIHKRGLADTLAAGAYVVEARSLGRNDRLDYRLTLRATEMQPGQARLVSAAATVPFTLAQERVVSLTTFGPTELVGLLKDADGRVLERLMGRSDDWNIALSRRLPAGSYRLVFTPAQAQPAEVEDTEDEPSTEARNTETRTKETDIEVHFALPEVVEVGTLAFGVAQQLSGPQVHQLRLPSPPAGSLLVVAAQARTELVLTLERQDAATGWSTVGVARSKTPVLAVPVDQTERPWRVAVWGMDGGATPLTLSAVTRDAAPQVLGSVTLTPFQVAGLETPLALAQIQVPEATIVTLSGAVEGLDVGATPGRPLQRHTGSPVVPQTERLWLLGPAAATVTVAPTAVPGPVALSLNEGETARIPAAPVPPGRLRFWHAESTFGQPGLEAGLGMGVTPGAAFGQDNGAMLRVWNADGDAALRLRVRAIEVPTLPRQPLRTRYSAPLPAQQAQPLDLAPGTQQLDLRLAPHLGAVLAGGTQPPVTLWAGEHATSRTLVGDWTTLVMVNAGTSAAPAAVDVLSGAGGRLEAGQVVKRFVGASGALSLQVEALAGDRLLVAGAQATFLTPGGRVQRGTALTLAGPGTLTLEYDPGLIAAWIERAGVSPWPSATPQPVTLPQHLALTGQALVLEVAPAEPVLLRLRTTAPVILALTQGTRAAPTLTFPAGAELSRYLDAGSATLRLYAPHDGTLTGSLDLTATPIEPISEGLGEAHVLAPGGTLLFGFEVTRPSAIGMGVRATPDQADVRLLDATGHVLGEGMVQMRRLTPGRYVLEARAPAQGTTLTVRPALVGLVPPSSGTPPDVAATYLNLAPAR